MFKTRIMLTCSLSTHIKKLKKELKYNFCFNTLNAQLKGIKKIKILNFNTLTAQFSRKC